MECSIAWTDGARPARLLDVTIVEKDGQPGLRLFETTPGHFYRYVCLGHGWDDTIHHHIATTQILAESMENIELFKLPSGFRDSVIITRDLGTQ